MTVEEIKLNLHDLREQQMNIIKFGQTITIAGQTLTHANLADIARLINELELKLVKKNRKGRFFRVVLDEF